MGKIIVIGHKNPDTDTIISSIVAAEYCKNILKVSAEAKRAGQLNNETKFILDKFKVKTPTMFRTLGESDSVVLVDHNEIGQIADGLNFPQVVRIIDHHKLQITTERPISVRIESLGSTSSLLAKMYQEAGKKIPTILAKLLVAGILSDTWNLTGPTTAEEDKQIIRELNKIAKLKLDEFAKEMFAAKSSLKGVSIKTVVDGDCKLFKVGKFKLGVAVWETTDPTSVVPQKGKIIELLRAKKSQEKLDYLFFFIVDLLKQSSVLYFFDEAEKGVAEKAFKVKIAGDEVSLPGVASRKKQIIPPLTAELVK